MAQMQQIQASVELTLEDDNNEANSTKRMKPGGVTGKSVVVLRSSDVARSGVYVFMPNTIEMAQLKKQGKGQFKTNVEISSNMTEIDIKRKLVEIFPILKHKRFYCAAAVDNRSRLEFHGEPRIWDGHYIKRKIKGNSALYILTEEEQQRIEHIVRGLEQSTLKRSHDEVTTNEKSDSSVSDMVPVEMAVSHTVYSGSEGKQAKFFAVPGNPQKGYPIVVPGATQTVLEKSDINLQPLTEGQLTQKEVLDKLQPMHGFVLCHPNVSTVHSINTARNVITMATSSLPQSLPMGTFMVPAGGVVVATPAGSIGNKAISTASEQQSLGKAVFHMVKGPDARQPGLQLAAPQVMVSSMLTPQMSNLNISSATSQQSQKLVIEDKSIGKRDQDVQTSETTETSQQAPTIITLGQSKRHYPVVYKTATELQEVVRFKTADHSRQSLDEKISSSHITEKGACAYNTAMDRQHQRPAVPLTSDHESLLSDPSDSGIEIMDSSGEGISQSKEKSYLDVVEMQRLKLRQKAANLNEAEWNSSGFDTDAGLSLLSGVALNEIRSAVTETKSSFVEDICPKSSSIRGGSTFVLILNEHLPSDVVSGHAYFGNSAPVPLTKINEVNMAGTIPACQEPGTVTVNVESSTGNYLGNTLFEYVDEVQDILQQLVRDSRLQAMFFHFWAQELGNKTDESEKRRPSQPPPNFKTDATEKPGVPKNVSKQLFNAWDQPAEHSVVRTPACQEPGIVTVKVESSTGNYLGQTWFEYVDEFQDLLRQLVRDSRLQAMFFHFWAQELGEKTDESEKQRTSQPPPSLLETLLDYTDEVPDILQQLVHDSRLQNMFFHIRAQELGNQTDESEKRRASQPSPGLKADGNQDNESDYDSDDEASSSDSSDDGNVSCNKVASGYPNSKMFFNDVGDEFTDEREEQIEGGWEVLFVFYERLNNSPDSDINENLDNLPFHGLESEATISQFADSSAFLVKCEEQVSGLARNDKILDIHEVTCDNCGNTQDNCEAPGRSNNPENTEIIDGNLNYVDVDQNLVADRTRRAEERSGDEEEDSPADPL